MKEIPELITSPEQAIEQLTASDRGRRALRDLSRFLENGGMSLDSENQGAVHALLGDVWRGNRSATVRGMIRESVGES